MNKMKLLIGIFLTVFIVQAIGVPIENVDDETTNNPETTTPTTVRTTEIPTTPPDTAQPTTTPTTTAGPTEPPEPEVDFVEELEHFYSWYLAIHDRITAELRVLRLKHVQLIEEHYEHLVQFFAEDMVELQNVAEEYRQTMQQAIMHHEGMTDCLRDVQTKYDRKLSNVNGAIRECARYANSSMAHLKDEVFYPTLNVVQLGHAYAPLAILQTLSRANIMTEQSRILEYAKNTFAGIELGWTTGVEQSFAWETHHFEVEAGFLIEEMSECSAYEATNFVADVIRLMREIDQCEAEESI